MKDEDAFTLAGHYINKLDAVVQELLAENKKLKERAMNNQMAADCMHMIHMDMLQAGVITKDVPPMFMSEAILSMLYKQSNWIKVLEEFTGDVACGVLRKRMENQND